MMSLILKRDTVDVNTHKEVETKNGYTDTEAAAEGTRRPADGTEDADEAYIKGIYKEVYIKCANNFKITS